MLKKFNKSIKLSCLALSVLLCACSSDNAYRGMYDKEFTIPRAHVFIQAEDKEATIQKELELSKLSTYLDKVADDKAQRASALYTLAAVYDSLGLEATARTILVSALMLRPDFADAYNLLGFFLSLEGRYLEAVDAFDQALELGSKWAYINRGVSLIYAGKDDMAIRDLKQFYEFDKNDPYRIIWLYIAEKNALGKSKAHELMAKRYSSCTSDKGAFANSVIELYLGLIDENEYMQRVRNAVTVGKGNASEILCDAYYYLSRLKLDEGYAAEAYDYLKLTQATKRYDFLEYRLAAVDLKKVKDMLGFKTRTGLTQSSS